MKRYGGEERVESDGAAVGVLLLGTICPPITNKNHEQPFI